MARKTRPIAAESRIAEARKLVLDLFSLLDSHCRLEFPGVADRLLPTCNGWTYHPLWESPRPDSFDQVDNRPLVKLSRSFLLDVLTNSNLHDRVQRGIMTRAATHGLLHRGEEILGAALREASADLKHAESTLSLIMSLEPSRIDPQNPPDFIAWRGMIAVHRVRLHMLSLWRATDRKRLELARRSRPSAIRVDNFVRLIRPNDVFAAWEIIEDYGKFEDEEACFERVGEWYAYTLWRCGATWKELLAIRHKSRRQRGRRGPRFLTWAELAKRKTQRASD